MDGCGRHSMLNKTSKHREDAGEDLSQWRTPHSAPDPLEPQEGRDHVT
jgi:hypothetical protein